MSLSAFVSLSRLIPKLRNVAKKSWAGGAGLGDKFGSNNCDPEAAALMRPPGKLPRNVASLVHVASRHVTTRRVTGRGFKSVRDT